jgi:hypothetical protein
VRTTLTLEPDVAAQLKRAMRTRGDSLKDTVNAALRAGLAVLSTPPSPHEAFTVRTFNLGPSLVGSLDNIEEVLSRVEGEEHR